MYSVAPFRQKFEYLIASKCYRKMFPRDHQYILIVLESPMHVNMILDSVAPGIWQFWRYLYIFRAHFEATVTRREPDVRFGKPDTIVSGFQIDNKPETSENRT